MNKTTEALKLAEEALYAELESDTCKEFAEAAEKCHKALAAIREALADQTQLQQAKEMLLAVDDVVKQSLSDIEALAEQDDFAASGKPMDHIAASGKMIAEPVKQRPVAWRVHPFDYGVGHEGAYAMTMRLEQVEAWNRKGWIVESLYATPVDAKAIRAEALEEAAEWCDRLANNGSLDAEDCAAAIRGLK